MEELEQQLDEAIRYLTTNGSIKEEDLSNLLLKRLPGFTISDVQARYPNLRIISSSTEDTIPTHSIDIPATANTPPVSTVSQPAQSQTTEQLLGDIRRQLMLKDVNQAKMLLAKLESVEGHVKHLAELQQEVDDLVLKVEEIRRDISRLESAGKYYELREKISILEVSFANFPGLADIKLRTASKIEVAEAHLSSARSKKAGKDKVDSYLRALEACKDCSEATSALSLLPPDPPGNLQVELLPNCISLSWTSSPTGLGVVYRLLKKRGNRSAHALDGEILTEMTELFFVDMDVIPGESYSYAVYALRGGVCSATASTTGPVLFMSEIIQPGVSIGNAEIRLYWQLPPNAKGIEILRSLNSAPSHRIFGETFARLGTVSEYIDKDVHNDLTYGYLICTIFDDLTGREYYSSGVRLTATPLSPPAPVSVMEATLEGEQINLEWEPTLNSTTIIIESARPLKLRQGELIEEEMISGLGELITIPFGSKRTSCTPQRIGQHFFTALSIADKMVVVGKSTSVNYVPPLNNPQPSISAGEIFLEWQWPTYSAWARIEYCNDLLLFEQPNHFHEREIMVKIMSRKDYDFHQGFVLKNFERKPYYFRLFHLPNPDADPAFWSSPLIFKVDTSAEVNIKYSIKISYNLFRKPKAAFLHISCNDFDKVPNLELLFKTGGIPTQKETGKFVMKIDRYELSRPEVRIEIPIEFLGQDRYAKLFFEDNTTGNLRLRHPSLENLQLF